MKYYEETIVIDGSLENEQIDTEVKKIEELIQTRGGKIHDINRWGRKKLAYPIRKKEQGYYIVITFEAEGSSIVEFEHELELNETVLRYLSISASQESAAKEKK
ncbi:MAG: 30S ribosomal protein S6 [Gemmatimonadota bacterium]|nr:MAG: 30S ribosomal protein S6 [Gemmatimonadota bacterium]